MRLCRSLSTTLRLRSQLRERWERGSAGHPGHRGDLNECVFARKLVDAFTTTMPYTSSPTPKTTAVVISTCMGPRPDLKGAFQQVLNANEIPGLVKFIYDQNGVNIKNRYDSTDQQPEDIKDQNK